MTLTLHTVSGAPRGWRVLLGFAFKGLEYNTRYLQSSKREHKMPAFLALNPRGTVPVVEAGDRILRDSIGILAWLDRQHPENPLFGETAEEAAEIWQIALECCDYLRDAITGVLAPAFTGDGSVPPLDSDEMIALNTAARVLHDECRFVEDLLADRPFLAGNAPSAADAVAFPEIRLIQRAVETKPKLMSALGFANPPFSYPKLDAWKARIESLPGVDKTFPIHWNA
ncbi:glutathione S-transferase family protein [Pelagibius sp. Alg239-R121]|uniref:glutathione S-transferase family protein n=1 Tax=Pelagibius sp. Alg239-R121 TaxID=2993448 RepID=UPI0024A6FF12|nr:glutathione S-transferase family protein [Pelagibius sp. Alg239-R121]